LTASSDKSVFIMVYKRARRPGFRGADAMVSIGWFAPCSSVISSGSFKVS
jgi:hypothetical protein